MSGSSLAKNVECNALSAKSLVADKGRVLRKGLAVAYYDFAQDGGAISAGRSLRGDKIPANAVITNTYINVKTIVAGGGTISLGRTGSLAAIRAANAVGVGATLLNATGWVAGVPVDTAATFHVNGTSDSYVQLVNDAAITAGKFVVYVEYLVAA